MADNRELLEAQINGIRARGLDIRGIEAMGSLGTGEVEIHVHTSDVTGDVQFDALIIKGNLQDPPLTEITRSL